MSKRGGTLKYQGNDIYPNAYYEIGDIFITTSEKNPGNRFGGTWQKLPGETYLMTASDNYTVKSTGGENEHTLTIDEIPSHNHRTPGAGNAGFANGGYTLQANPGGNNPAPNKTTANAGGGQPHNNMPKFYAVYVWIRIA